MGTSSSNNSSNNSSFEKMTRNNSPSYDRPTNGGKGSDNSSENIGVKNGKKRDKGEKARDRKLEANYSLCCIEAFDELRAKALTMEMNGQMVKQKKRPDKNGKARVPKKGELVVLKFNAYVWDPQTQALREFASSDKLKAPPQGISQGEAGANGMMMEFVIGKNECIDGLEEAVKQMELNQKMRIVIGPKKGYGDVGSPPEIPGNCFLVYDLDLTRIAGGNEYAPPNRNQIFSVGISKPPVQTRPQKSFKDFRGFKSMDIYKGGDKGGKSREKYRKQMGIANGAGVDSETYKGKLDLAKLQEIVRKNQYDDFGIVPKRIEEYLVENQFKMAFGVEKTVFLLLPAYKKNQMRKQARLV